MDHLCYLCLVFFMLLRLFSAALWSPAGKGLTSWLSLVIFNRVFVTFPCGMLGQVWYLIVMTPDYCCLTLKVLSGFQTHDFNLSTALQQSSLLSYHCAKMTTTNLNDNRRIYETVCPVTLNTTIIKTCFDVTSNLSFNFSMFF